MIGTKRGISDVLDSAGESDRDGIGKSGQNIYGFGASFGFEVFGGGIESDDVAAASRPIAAANDELKEIGGAAVDKPGDIEVQQNVKGICQKLNAQETHNNDNNLVDMDSSGKLEDVGAEDRDSDDESDEMGYDIGKLLNKINARTNNQSTQVVPDSSIHVLLIDDSEVVRKMGRARIAGKLDNETWFVSTAETGERATTLIETSGKTPDVIIVDQYLSSAGGKLLGNQWVSHVRRNPNFAETIIIGCSDYTSEARQAFLDAGCDAVWPKPLPLRDVIHEKIRSLWTGGLPKSHRSASTATATATEHENVNSNRSGNAALEGANQKSAPVSPRKDTQKSSDSKSPAKGVSNAPTGTAAANANATNTSDGAGNAAGRGTSAISSADMQERINLKLSLLSQKPIIPDTEEEKEDGAED